MAQVVIFSDTSRQGIWLRGIGPYSLSSYIRSRGYTAEVIDFTSAISYNDFCKLTDKFCGEETLLVGISTTWMSAPRFTTDLKKSFGKGEGDDAFFSREDHPIFYDSLSWAMTSKTHKRFTDYMRQAAPNAEIVLGGARAIDFICEDFDRCILGYSENQIIDLLDKKKILLGKIINHDIKGEIGDFDFNQSVTQYEDNDFLMEDETLPIELGRGCIFQCKYCSFPLIGKKKLTYMKDIDLLKQEFTDNWNKFKIKRYIISDDTFNDSLEKLQALADMIDTLPFKPQFWCFARLDLMTVKPEMIELFQRIGIKEVQFGIESFHQDSARTIGKGMGPDTKKETLHKLKEAWGDDITIKCSFIIGLPHETTATLEEHYSWLASDECPINAVGINPLFLAQPDEYQEYRWNSFFDLHYEDYGYYFEDPKHHFDWKKKDETDITSFAQCFQLYTEWQERINQRQTNNHTTDAFYYSNVKELPYTFDEMFYGKLSDAKHNHDWKSMFFTQVKEKYIDRKLND